MSAAKARIAAGSIISDTATVLSDVVIAGKQIQIKGAKRLPVVDSTTPVSDEPLFIIDGIPVKNNDQLDYLDRNSIADVKVWKGDSAIARYGSRGVNGVVVVTTKDLAVAPKPGNPKTASVQDMGFPKRKIQSVTQQAVASALSEHVAGAAVTDTGALLQVNIRRVSGHLKPEGGFDILKSYLEKRIAMDIQKGRLTALDTGKVSFEVRLDSTAHRKEVTVKTASSDRLFHWFSQIIGSGPDWNLEKGYKNNDRKTPTEVSVELTRLL
jgi:TonB-dependent SusC/RagA subfamily outer membrane receptor